MKSSAPRSPSVDEASTCVNGAWARPDAASLVHVSARLCSFGTHPFYICVGDMSSVLMKGNWFSTSGMPNFGDFLCLPCVQAAGEVRCWGEESGLVGFVACAGWRWR